MSRRDSSAVYMDNAATTRVDPRVAAAMWPMFLEGYGNAASVAHPFGREAAAAVETGRAQVAAALGARSAREIVFTSGATESNNLALKGVVPDGAHVITCRTEHKSVLDSCAALEARGCEVTMLTPEPDGRVRPEQVEAAIGPRTALVSLMRVNNETGAVHPIAAIGAITRPLGVLLHCDATQALGKVDFDVRDCGVDLASVSAHKVYGPKGVGALYVRRRAHLVLQPAVHGGGQERGLRAGTLNVPGIVGFGVACELAMAERAEHSTRVRALRHRLEAYLGGAIEGVVRHGASDEHSAPGIVNLRLPGIESESLLASLRGVAVSGGSACNTGSLAPSHVLTAMGIHTAAARNAIRFSIGRFNTVEEVDRVAEQVVEIAGRPWRRNGGHHTRRRPGDPSGCDARVGV